MKHAGNSIPTRLLPGTSGVSVATGLWFLPVPALAAGDGPARLLTSPAVWLLLTALAAALSLLAMLSVRLRKLHSANVQQQARYRLLFDNFPLGITISDAQGRIVETNSSAARILGVEKEEHEGRLIDGEQWVIVDASGADMSPDTFASVVALKERRQVLNQRMGIVRPDGCTSWLSVSASPLPGEGAGALVAYGDITELVQAETEHARSEELFQRFFHNLGTLALLSSSSGRILEVNDHACRVLGYSRERMLDSTIQEVFTASCRPRIEAMLNKRSVHRPGEQEVVCSDGSTRLVLVEMQGVDIAGGQTGCTWVLFDVTELRRLESEYRTLYDQVPLGVAQVDLDSGKFISVNQRFLHILGFDASEADNLSVAAITHPDDRESTQEIVRILRDGLMTSFTTEKRYIGKNGETILGKVYGNLLPDYGRDHGRAAIISLEDITGQRLFKERQQQLEAHLQQVQRLESVGLLAAGVAHDFNNILYPITGHAEMMLDDLEPGHALRLHAGAIIQAAERGRDLVQQMLSLAKGEGHELKPLQPLTVVQEALRMVRPTLSANIAMVEDLDPNCFMIRGNSTQLLHMVMNLLLHGIQAMTSTSGALTVSLGNIEVRGVEADMAKLPPGQYVRLRIRDEGAGMDAATLAGLFDPYRTEQGSGGVPGFGLHLTKKLLQDSGGDIVVQSEPGTGTTCTLLLPRYRSAGLVEPMVRNRQETGPRRAESARTVLVVDDEETVLLLIEQILKRHGYRPTTARSAVQALELFRQTPDAFDAMITDLNMPQMSGMELSRKVLALKPEMPVLLCTGYAEEVNEEEVQRVGIRVVLYKPVSAHNLALEVANALG